MTSSRNRLTILDPGLLTTVQDLGRPGYMRIGVTPGGALDRAALVLGNRLVGNEPGAAALEITLLGPRLRFSTAAVVALTGADLGAAVNGTPLPRWLPVRVAAGDKLAFATTLGPGEGARAYLCVAGGIDVAPVMESRSTDLFGGFGGWRGRALVAGDELPVGASSSQPDDLLRRRLAQPPPPSAREGPVRAVLGPQTDRFAEVGIATFFDAEYRVSPQSDRMGLRLSGPAIALAVGADLVSEGIAHGAVQVPGDGQPIALLAGRQTIGGYPKIATVIAADLDALGQRRPGDPVRFSEIGVLDARALALAYHAGLGEAAVVVAPRPTSGWSADPTRTRKGRAGMDTQEAWAPDGVARLVEALRGADVTSFRLALAGIGLTLEVEWAAPARAAAGPASEHASGDAVPNEDPSEQIVTAPLLGVFFRRPTPDDPPFAEEGDRVEAGQALGLIEVMKTFHEVTAPRAGTLIGFLVEDGATVEYGQPIAEVEPPTES